jgi:hypothetical protein
MKGSNSTGSAQDNTAAQENNGSRRDVAQFDHFLDTHPEIAEQVRKDPSLLDNRQFVQNHPALQTYLQNHPTIRDDVRQNPVAFMQRESQFNNREDAYHDANAGDRDRDSWRGKDAARFNHFLDTHPEIAQQVRKDPSLLDNRQFVQNHPALQTYLQNNPGLRDEVRQNPDTFAQQENRADTSEGTHHFSNGNTTTSTTHGSGSGANSTQQSANGGRTTGASGTAGSATGSTNMKGSSSTGSPTTSPVEPKQW